MIRATATALRRAAIVLRILGLRYRAHETEAYIRACERDGLVDSLALTEWRGQVCAWRAEEARLTNQLHPVRSAARSA